MGFQPSGPVDPRTGVTTREEDEALPGLDIALERLVQQPLWRIRLRLWRKRLRQNWRLFARNKIGVIGLVVIGIFAVMAVIHPILMDNFWNPRIYDPVIGYDAPRVEFTVVADGEPYDRVREVPRREAIIRGCRLPCEVGTVIVDRVQPAPPSRTHLLGTDPLGRDVLSQLLFGTRAAFMMAAIAAFVTAFFATIVGAMAAYYGKATDAVLMRVADLLLLMPLIPLLVFVSGMWQVNLPALGLMIGVVAGLGPTAIVLKSQALSVKVKPFIDAAKVAGGSNRHIIARHIIPNILPLSLLYMMFTVTTAISAEAALSFFGLLDIPMSWGIMIHTAQVTGYLLGGTDFWWLLLPAGGAVTILAAAFYLVGRAMDEVINPRLRQR